MNELESALHCIQSAPYKARIVLWMIPLLLEDLNASREEALCLLNLVVFFIVELINREYKTGWLRLDRFT